MTDILARMMDQAINRLTGVYSGFSPSRPKMLVIPRFVAIERELHSLVGAIGEHIDLERIRNPLVISDTLTWQIAGAELFGELADAGLDPLRAMVTSNRYGEAEQIAMDMTSEPRVWSDAAQPWERRLYAPKSCSLVFAVGGGTVIDIAKLTAFHLHIPCVTVPTSLAHDGIASPFAVIRPAAASGAEDRVSSAGTVTVVANTPLGVLIDLSRIKPRPGDTGHFYHRMMLSGIGDAVSNLTATLDWSLAAEKGHDHLDYLALLHARSAGEVVLARLLRGASLDQDDLVLTLAAGLVSSGEAMARVGSSRPASGFEHKLYHAFQNILGHPSKGATHGVLVALGTLIAAELYGQWADQLQEAFLRIGLPADRQGLQDWGIDPAHIEESIEVATRVKPERYTILEDKGPAELVKAFRSVYG